MPPFAAKQDEPMLADLMIGFEALTRKVDELVAKNSALEKQLKVYAQQPVEVDAHLPSRRSSEQLHSTAPTSISEWRDNECFAPGIEAWKKLKEMRGRNVDAEKLERDFTTPGRAGDLRCPFSERPPRELSRGTAGSFLRTSVVPAAPCIEEEPYAQVALGGNLPVKAAESSPASVQNSTTKCPIRYLDDHSPEEVAKYFENHKHEIPRSHEVCVKRYQGDGESVKQLDAKYGNLVNMIQGLGVKHQPLLPVNSPETGDQKSMDKVERWAENCVDDAPPAEDLDDTKSEIRTGHFERPLQEVRLGESPSRPWGIQVPLEKQAAASADGSADSNAAQSIAAAVESRPSSEVQEQVKQCPFSQFVSMPPVMAKNENVNVEPATRQHHTQAVIGGVEEVVKKSGAPSIVFNGPVFFGYPAADVETILRSMQRNS